MITARAATASSSGAGTLVFTRHYSPDPTGSAPPMAQLAEWLARSEQVQVVTSRPSYPDAFVHPDYANGQHDRASENGVELLRWPTTAVHAASIMSRFAPEFRFMLQQFGARVSGRVKPSSQLVSLCPSIFTVFGALAFRARGGLHVAVVHDIQSGLGTALGSPAVRVAMKLLRHVERWTLNRVDHIVVLSQSMADALTEIGVVRPITILPPQVDCNTITPLPRPDGAPPTLMYSGNFGRKQGLDQILDVAAILRERAPEVVILLRGEGAMRQPIADRIGAEQLTNVRLTPLVPVEQIAESMAEGDIHLVPQIADGGDFAVPSKAFAIMAAGRPFIATCTPDSAIARLADESRAFVCVPPYDAEAFADQVVTLLQDADRRRALGEAGRRFVLGHADTEVVMLRIRELLTGSAGHDALPSEARAAPTTMSQR